MRGGFAAPRRPRSGFKELSQGCENEETALNDLKRARERSRKEIKALGSSSSSGRRNKRTRSGLGEQLYRGSDEDDGYDTVEVSHGGSPAPSHSRSEEDEEGEEDGEEARRTINHRRPANRKLKSHKLSDDIIGAGLSSIPRKARSAYVKRPHESSPSAPPSDGIAVQPCITAPSPSAKSGRRTKPPGTKPRPAKFAKVSAAFSEREVEVAEVLFGFAKQFTNESCVEDANELKTSSPSSLPPNVVSPIQISSPVSVSASPLPPPAEAPKRKRPRVAVRTEEIRSPASTTVEQACQSTEMDNLPSDNTDAIGGFIKGIAPGPSTTPDSPQNHANFVQVGNPCLPSFQNHGVLDRKTSEKVMASLPAGNKAGVPEMVDGASELARSQTETEGIDAPADMSRSGDSTEKIESSKLSPLFSKTENTPMEKLEIDLMASPLKETDCLDKEKDNDNGPNVVGNAGAEFSGGTEAIDSVSEFKAVAVKQVIEEEKREQEVEEERENGDCKRENGVERGIEQHCVKEEDVEGNKPGDVWKERDKDLSKQQLQKLGKITKSDPRTQMPERSDVSSSLVSVPGNISGFPSGAESLPLSMAVAGWHGGLPTLGRYFGPSSATWPGSSSLPGVMPVEGNSTLAPTMQPGFILQSQQTLKRCAAHAYIAHFIEYQKQIAHQPFWAATYSTSSALYGVKPYNLNIPLPPPTDSILGGSVLGTASASSVRSSGTASHNIMGSSSNDSNVGQNLKEKVTATYMDALWKHPVQQQAAQRTLSTIIQRAPPFGFPITESGASCSAAINAGNGSATTGRNSGSRPSVHGGDPTTSIGGTTEVNSSFASMASAAQAQYLAMLQHNGYPVPLPHAHFGATSTGAHNHLGHQQIFNGSFYATHLIHPPLQTQQQGQQNPNTTGGLSSTQKQQQQLNFSSLQQQLPSNSPHHHLFLSPQSIQVENEGSKVVDGASSVDKKLPMAQKSFHGQGTPSNSNSNVNPSSLLAASLPIHTQDLTLMAGLGVKHTGKQQPVSMQHHGADPSLHMSWKGQQCNQNAKPAAGRAKTTSKSIVSNYGDHVASDSNHSNFQESGITSGQTLKQQQQDQHSPQWKVPSTVITSAGAASQAVIVAAMRNLPQQGQYQSVNSNSMANSSGAAIPQSVFATSTKNYGQQQRNLHNNSGCSSASNTKSAGTPSKTASGNKGSIPRPQRSVAPTSAKKSSPNHLSQSPSSKSSQKQYEQQQRTSSQATVSGGSGQAAGSKNQQYYSQAHFNQQQSYQLQQALPQQIQQQLLFSQNQYIHQQAVQQSQLSAQSAQQAAVLHQQPSMQGFNYSQPSFSNPPHRQQEQQQQTLPVSSTPSNPVCNETLSVGLPMLTLGSASTGRGAAKIMPSGSLRDNGTATAILHPQYSPHNGTVSARVHSGNSQMATISSPYMQTVPIVSRKVGEQKVGSDGLKQDQVNGVLLLPNSVDLNMCAQTNVNTSSVPSSSSRTMTGNLKKAQGVNIMESMPSRGGINLSVVSSGLAYQDLGANSGQTPSMSTNQHPVSLAAGPISSAISTPLEAAASIVHP